MVLPTFLFTYLLNNFNLPNFGKLVVQSVESSRDFIFISFLNFLTFLTIVGKVYLFIFFLISDN